MSWRMFRPGDETQAARMLRRDEVHTLLGSVQLERDYAMLATLLDTGTRIGELASTTRESVSAEGVLVFGKTSERIVLMSPSASEPAGSQENEAGSWTGSRGRLADRALQRTVRRSMRRAGIKPPMIRRQTPQSIIGTHYILRGVDVFSQQRIMGQRHPAALMVCTEMSTDLVERQHRKFSPPTLRPG